MPKNKFFIIGENGQQTRDFTYIDDIVKMTIELAKRLRAVKFLILHKELKL